MGVRFPLRAPMKTKKLTSKIQKPIKQEFSAGGVVFKKIKIKRKFKIVFLLGKHSGYHKWVLPKGLIEKGETPKQTAVRETEEEVGVKTKIIGEKIIHQETYFYWADLKKIKTKDSNVKTLVKNSKLDKTTRRVARYQEQGGKKTKIAKTVSFFLLKYVSGSPKKHGWEMETAGWFSFSQALKLMSFKGEKEALKKAWIILSTQK